MQIYALKPDKLSFRAILIIVCILVLLAITFLAVLGENLPPHVGNMVGVKGSQESAEYVGQEIRFTFSRPMDDTSLVNNIHVYPNAEFDTFWSGNSLLIVFTQVLSPDTEYALTLKGDIDDVYGKKLGTDFVYKFTTKARQWTYIERNGGYDKIILVTENFHEIEEIFTSEHIISYDIGQRYITAVVDKDKRYWLQGVDIETHEVHTIEQGDVRVSDISYSPAKEEVVYTLEELSFEYGVPVPKSGHKIFIYDLEAHQRRELVIPLDLGDIITVDYYRDGTAILLKNIDGNYFLVDVGDPSKYVLLGRHMSSSDFNYKMDKIVFTNLPYGDVYALYPFVTLTTGDRETISLSDGDIFRIDYAFMPGENAVIFSQQIRVIDGAMGIFKLMKQNLDTQEMYEILVDDDRSLELPNPSYDGQYIALERYNISDITNYENLRNYGFQSKPFSGDIIILDMKSGEIIDAGIRGAQVEWRR